MAVGLTRLAGLAAARGDVASARALFEQSQALSGEVSRAAPDNTEYRRDVAAGLDRLAGLADARGAYPHNIESSSR